MVSDLILTFLWGVDMGEDACIFCDSEFGFNECKTEVRKAVKPKGSSYRWVVIGCCCDNCSDTENTSIDYDANERVK